MNDSLLKDEGSQFFLYLCIVKFLTMEYSKTFVPIWADMDPNRHMRHTAYNDYAAQVRVAFLQDYGYDIEKLDKLRLGPILFREETVFLREIRLGDTIKVDLRVSGLSKEGRRWNMVHRIYNQYDKLSAIIKVEGAWIDMDKRKLIVPPKDLFEKFKELPRTEDYAEIVKMKN